MADKNRPLYILKYLWDHTDENHPAVIADILTHLAKCGIQTNRKTIAADLVTLQDSVMDGKYPLILLKIFTKKIWMGNMGISFNQCWKLIHWFAFKQTGFRYLMMWVVLGGYIDFLKTIHLNRSERKREEMREWAGSLGWTGRITQPNNFL